MPLSRLSMWCFLALVSLLLAACSSAKPETTVEAFYQAAIKRDVDKAVEQLALGEVSDGEMFQAKGKIQMIIGQIAEVIEKNDGLKRFEVLESNIDENEEIAHVQIKLIFSNGEENTDSFRLRREDGKWKIIMH